MVDLWELSVFLFVFWFQFWIKFCINIACFETKKFKLFVPLGLGLTNIDWHLYAFC